MTTLLEVSPKAHTELQKRLRKDLEKDVYISQYRLWEGRVGYHSIYATAAVQKALINDNFKVISLEMEL